MAIAEDASSPASVYAYSATSSSTVTTASFTPPANSLVLVMVATATAGPIPAISMSDSGSHTWTAGPAKTDIGYVATAHYWCYFAASPGPITITAGNSPGTGDIYLTVRVLTGASPVQNGATIAVADDTATTSPLVPITTTTPGSVPYFTAAVLGGGTLTPNANTTNVAANTTSDDLAMGRAPATVTPGTETVGWSISSATYWVMSGMEILPSVAFDAVGPSASGAIGAASPLTWTHTAAAGAAVLVGVTLDNASSSWTCAATYGGTPMTLLKAQAADNGSSGFGYLFGIANVPGGASTVSVSFTGGTTDVITAGSMSFTGAGTTVAAAFGTPVASAGTGNASLTASIGSSSLFAGHLATGAGAAATPTTGTDHYEISVGSSGWCGSSNGTTSNTGSIAWSNGSSTYAAIGVEVIPAPPPPAGSNSGPNFPTTGAVSGSGTGTWTNPGNITADDGSVATWTVT